MTIKLEKIMKRVGCMTYKIRGILLTIIDTFIVLTSFYISFYLVNNGGSTSVTQIVITTSLLIVIFHHLFAVIFKLYQKAWEYASIGELLSIFNVVTISIVLAGISQFIIYSEILRSEEHTSELQSRGHLVCRLL